MEKIINTFPIFEENVMTCIGFRVHELSGTDEEKITFLKGRIDDDFKEMAIALLPDNFTLKLTNGLTVPGITLERYNTLLHNGTEGILYEGIYQIFGFGDSPLQISTPVKNGKIRIDHSIYPPTEPIAPFTTKIHEEIQEHYLDQFMTKDGFRLVELIDKDFFGSIRLTYDQGYFVSCLKLLLSAIDSIAFLEFGDVPNKNIFIEWLKLYCSFSETNVNEQELWEYRNSLLHMTNSQ
ncbi:hypothetical protein EON73_03005 [bacterium]|nr:MAG: hypothetical protein EON73_03005 [bacterium]